MNKRLKIIFCIFTISLMTVLLWGAADTQVRFRLYEGFKEKGAAADVPAHVISSYRLKAGIPEGMLSDAEITSEKEAMMRVYNVKDIKLITRDVLTLTGEEKKPQSHEIVSGDRAIKIQLIHPGKDDVFNLTLLEKYKSLETLLETEIVMPEGKTGTMGFEGKSGKIYFLSFNRLKEPADDDEDMHVFIYDSPTLIRKIDPEYPVKAMDEWIKGTVVLDIAIDTGGNVTDAGVIKGAHKLLDEAALAAVKQWKYKPLRLKGGLKALMAVVTFQFELTPAPEQQAGGQGSLLKPRVIRRSDPVYPPTALRAYIQGNVVLEVVNDSKGNVKKVKVINGHPLLREAAAKAVKKWKYEPYLIDGEAKPVIFNETINFSLKSRKNK
ncbi:MAG: TonB family protein [bacterium]|nr:TonB family protein [bacterium]